VIRGGWLGFDIGCQIWFASTATGNQDADWNFGIAHQCVDEWLG